MFATQTGWTVFEIPSTPGCVGAVGSNMYGSDRRFVRESFLSFLPRLGGLEFDQAARFRSVAVPWLLAAARHGAVSTCRVHRPPPSPEICPMLSIAVSVCVPPAPQVMATNKISLSTLTRDSSPCTGGLNVLVN